MTMRGEKVYECDFDVTGVTDFGITLDAIFSGKEKIPPQRARVDVAYAGAIKGRVSGSIRGWICQLAWPRESLGSLAQGLVFRTPKLGPLLKIYEKPAGWA